MYHLLLKYAPPMEMSVVFLLLTIPNNDAINILTYFTHSILLKSISLGTILRNKISKTEVENILMASDVCLQMVFHHLVCTCYSATSLKERITWTIL